MEPPVDPDKIAMVMHHEADTSQFHPDPANEPLSPVWGSRFTADGRFEYLTEGDMYQQWVNEGRPSVDDMLATMQAMLVEMYRRSDPVGRVEIERRIRDAPGQTVAAAEAEIAQLRSQA